MPVPGFLTSIADKAQSAINASPLAGRIQALSQERPSSPDNAAQPSANEAAGQGGHMSHTLGAIQHHLRAFGQQYSSTTPVQKIITAEKGVAIACDSLARESQIQSKEFYTWGQTESPDIRDVTDRLAWLNFVSGSLTSSLAVKLDGARATFKALREKEAVLTPRRNIRAGVQLQIDRLQNSGQKGMEGKIKELKEQLKVAERADGSQEKEVELLKRKAIRETEHIKWTAIREYGEKLVMLSQAADRIIGTLPAIPPSEAQPYTGAQATASARASLQHALDTYKPGVLQLIEPVVPVDLDRSDTRSFGVTHASELSSMASQGSTSSAHLSIPVSPPAATVSLQDEPSPAPSATAASSAAPPPAATSVAASTPAVPTVAETGQPPSGGAQPASGNLHDAAPQHTDSSPTPAPAISPTQSSTTSATPAPAAAPAPYMSAEQEKDRLRKEYSSTSTSSPAPPSSAAPARDDERARKEREERERFLRRGDSAEVEDAVPADGEDLPPYRDV